MKAINECIKKSNGQYPEKILQFGEGNFLRAFADWMIDLANTQGFYQGSIVLCQPIAQGLKDTINSQDSMYTVAMRGIENGTAVEKFHQVTSVSRCINPYENYGELMELARSADLEVVISNTTEAGIAYKEHVSIEDAPPSSFPAKVTAFLYERFKAFNGAMDKGLLFLPVELIDHNGTQLKHIVLQYAEEWKLGSEFINWVETANEFTNTLVDRIVTGYPKDQADYFEEKLGYRDALIDTCEIFNLWVIQGKKKWADKFPVHKTSANVIWTEDVKPYKKRKVRILNGGHTSTVLAAFLAGHTIVLDLMNDDIFVRFLKKVLFEEVIPTIDLPAEELKAFAGDVLDRFSNPYIKHKLLDISLNSCSKFNARCLPSLLDYVEAEGKLPPALTFSLAAFIKFYQGKRADQILYPVRDDQEVLDFFADAWSSGGSCHAARLILSNKNLWSGRDLTSVPGLLDAVCAYLKDLESRDVRSIIKDLL